METIKERRERFEQLGKLYPKAASVTTEQAFLGGVNCYWLIPENAAHNKIVVYLHGGAFAVGSILSHESMVSHFAAKLNTKILFVDYSLAPEKPFPAAVNDVVNVYKELLITYPNHKISFIGDSAGGGLIVSLCGELLKQQAKLPHAAIMISPWISLECNNPSHEGNRQKDVILTREYATASANDYTGSTPFAISSPEHVVLSQFPPGTYYGRHQRDLIRRQHQSLRVDQTNTTQQHPKHLPRAIPRLAISQH